MAVYDNSRYLNTTMFCRKGHETPTFRVRERYSFNENTCLIHEWCEGDTLDGVSYRYYEESALRWAILDANPQYRTEFDIKNGDQILIPSYEEVVSLVNE